MVQMVTLEMSYTTYLNLCDAVERVVKHAKDFTDIQIFVHVFDFLEEEYMRDLIKRNSYYETWRLHEEYFHAKETDFHKDFFDVKEIFDNYEDRNLLKWDISEQDKFHLICELIDLFKKDKSI